MHLCKYRLLAKKLRSSNPSYPACCRNPFDMKLAQMSARDFALRILWERLRPKEIYVGPSFAFGNRRQGSFNLLKEVGEEKGFWPERSIRFSFEQPGFEYLIRQALISGQVGGSHGAFWTVLSHWKAKSSVGQAGLTTPDSNCQTPDAHELIPRRGVYATVFA